MRSRGTVPDEDRTVLVTGATGGIGRELSKLFARDGYHLVINATEEDELREMATDLEAEYGSSVKVMPQDLSLPEAPGEIFSELQAESIEVDALVNSAGFAQRGPFAEKEPEALLGMMRVNMTALTELTRLFLSGMVDRGAGRVLNISSTAAFMPGPLMAVYYASKAYVLSFSQAIASELEGSGVTVTALCPGPTDTEFHERAEQTSTWLLYLLPRLDPERVARVGYRGLMSGRRIVIPSFLDGLIVFSQRFAPRGALTDLVRELHKRRDA